MYLALGTEPHHHVFYVGPHDYLDTLTCDVANIHAAPFNKHGRIYIFLPPSVLFYLIPQVMVI